MNANDIRKAYLDFFKDKQHEVINRASLILKDDPTTLFTGSGMQPLMPYLLGEEHPRGARLTDSQVCFRGDDIDDIGDSRHTTQFEMLGNWSLGDYFKEQQIKWVFEFLVDVVKLDPSKIYVTCFIGDEKYGIPRDDEAANIWKDLFESKGIDAKIVEIGSAEDGDKKGMDGGRIFFYDDKENWWSRKGGIEQTPIGDPCGPDSEMFFDFGEDAHDASYGKSHPASDGGQFFEIGNSVFMTYRKESASKFVELENKNIDCGLGLERVAIAAINSPDMFKISLLWPIIEKLQEVSGEKYEEHLVSMRIIADHIKAATFLGVDGMSPSNHSHGYIMRRLVRKAVRVAFELNMSNIAEIVVPIVADIYQDAYPEVAENRERVIDMIIKEEKVFNQTLKKGVRQFDKFSEDGLTGQEIFTLYDTFGFPLELSVEEAKGRGIKVSKNWKEEFKRLMDEQKERSRTASKGDFKGGLGGQTLQHKKYHTATHLMYQALRDVLGDHVIQHGSNITEERLRFDFSHPEKMTEEQKKQVEDIVNEQIKKDLVVTFAEYPTEEATGPLGALGQFGDRYGDTVKVYNMQSDGADKPFSFEICGGPHVDHTLQLIDDGRVFKIKKEQSSSAGIRRIKAILL